MKNRKSLGLALSSGGWRGLAHIGTIKVFEEEKIPIDFIAGSSAGALIGGLYAALGDIKKIEKIVHSIGYRDLIKLLFDPTKKPGLIKGHKITQFLNQFIGGLKIEELRIPYCAVAADLFQGKPKEIKTGNLTRAIIASCSIPFVFTPTQKQGKLLIDGGAAMPIPSQTVRDMGADVVVAVNLYANIFPFKKEYLRKKNRLTTLAVTRISYQMLLYQLALRDAAKADIVINPKIWEGHFSILTKFVGHKKAIEDGQKAAKKVVPKIKKLFF